MSGRRPLSPPPSPRVWSPCLVSDRFISFVFGLLGVGILIPWNAFISAKPYFEARFCEGEETPVHDNMEAWFSFSYNVGSVISLAILLWMQNYTSSSTSSSSSSPAVPSAVPCPPPPTCAGAAAASERTRLVVVVAAWTAAASSSLAWSPHRSTTNRRKILHRMSTSLTQDSSFRSGASSRTTSIPTALRLFPGDDDETNGKRETTSQQYEQQQQTLSTTWWMVMPSLAIFLLVFIAATLQVLWVNTPGSSSAVWTWMFRISTFLGLFVSGACTSMASAGVIGTAGLFPADLGIVPYVQGQAVGGVLVAVANLIASAAVSDPDRQEHLCQHSVIERRYNHNRDHEEFRRLLVQPIQSNLPPGFEGDSIDFIDLQLQPQSFADASSSSAAASSSLCIPYETVNWPSFVYFLAGCLVLAACMFGYACVEHYKGLHRRASEQDESCLLKTTAIYGLDMGPRNSNNDDDDERDAVSSASSNDWKDDIEEDDDPTASNRAIGSCQHLIVTEQDSSCSDAVAARCDESNETIITTMDVWKLIQGPAISMFLTFFVTLSVFPAITADLSSTHQCHVGSNRLQNDLFTPMTFVLFNVGDLFGRSIVGDTSMPASDERNRGENDNEQHRCFSCQLVWLSVARFLLIPMLLLCYSSKSASTNLLHDFILHSDVYSWIVQLLLAVTNGMLTSLCFSHAPRVVPSTARGQQISSSILNFAMSAGLLFGSSFSFVVLWILTGARF